MFSTKILIVNLLSTLGLGALVSSCASLSKDDQPKLEISAQPISEFAEINAAGIDGKSPYKFGDKEFQVEWLLCRLAKPRGAVIVTNRDQFGFEAQGFCRGWIAQAALAAGFNVIGVNRPGYGGSTGEVEFAGSQSVAALEAATQAVQSLSPGPGEIRAIWGHSFGAIAAAQFARKSGKLAWLLIGSGIFDTEQTLATTADEKIKDAIQRVVANEGTAGHQSRSIIWDLQGYPANIIIYHGAADTAVPIERAEAFRDALTSSGNRVELSVLPGIGHELTSRAHRELLGKVFERVDFKQ
jgi:dienelactone hydrolase